MMSRLFILLQTQMRLVVLAVCATSALLIYSCVPSERVINPPESDWQLLASTPDSSTRLVLINQPSNEIASQNLFSVLGANGIGGRVSKMVAFRENLYVLLPEQRRIEVLNAFDYRRRFTLNFAAQNRIPADIAFANATTGYIAFSNGSVVGVIDITALERGIVSEIPVGNAPIDLEVQENQIYCALQRGSAVAVIDSRTNSVTARISVGAAPTFLGVASNGRVLIAVGLGGGRVDASPRSVARATFVSLTNRTVLSFTPLSVQIDSLDQVPHGLVVTENNVAFVPINRSLVRLDARSFSRSIGVSGIFRSISYNPVRNEILLADSLQRGCTIVDPETSEIRSTISLPFRPVSLQSQ